MNQSLQSTIGIAASVIISSAIAFAASTHSVAFAGWPVFAICVFVAFAIQWIAFVPSWVLHSEHFFDLTGGITYITVTILAVLLASTSTGQYDGRALLIAALVLPWALRLSIFLFVRVRQAGSDQRFDKINRNFLQLLMTCTLQGMSVSVTLAAALAAMTSATREPLGIFALVGTLIWAVGFAIEVIADNQKTAFRKDPANAERFINTGLWRWSRHPNYFGEIVLWAGITVIAIPVLQGWQWVTLISPIFVIVLLTQISGIPMLERRADRRWGQEEEYRQYKASTSVLVPLPPTTAGGASQ